MGKSVVMQWWLTFHLFWWWGVLVSKPPVKHHLGSVHVAILQFVPMALAADGWCLSHTHTVYIRTQGMTLTARLPGAGNLLGRAGEDLSGLPRSQSKERKFVPRCRWKNLLRVFAMTTWATTMPVLVGILKQFLLSSLSFGGGIGGQGDKGGCQNQSVINEY